MASNWDCECPRCRAELVVDIECLRIRQKGAPKTFDKPPAVGDWVTHCRMSSVLKVISIEGQNPDMLCEKGGTYTYWLPRVELTVVRRKDAPLRVGDRGLLDGQIEVWVNNTLIDSWLRVVFEVGCVKDFAGTDDEFAWIRPDRFELTEPVYDQKED